MSIHEWWSTAPKHFYASVVFFILVVIITVVIFGYKQKITAENNNYREQVSSLQSTLSQLRKDKDVQAFELYDKNRNQLDILTYNSQVPLFYNEISTLWRRYNFEFSDFSFNKWNIKISALAKSDSTEQWYKKFRSLITDFYDARYTDDENWEKGDSNNGLDSILDLQFVKSFKWSNNISTLLEFIVKPEEKEPDPVVTPVSTPKIVDKVETGEDAQQEENAIIEAAIKQ